MIRSGMTEVEDLSDDMRALVEDMLANARQLAS